MHDLIQREITDTVKTWLNKYQGHGDITHAIDIKPSTSPKVSKSFWHSIATIAPDQTMVIAPVEGKYPIANHVMVMPLHAVMETLV